ncbi:MAG: hypothetical protein JJU01_06580, partial [Alkalibacterium sp.]|nr:hypothetical protein [Alkalibacterium sp.]
MRSKNKSSTESSRINKAKRESSTKFVPSRISRNTRKFGVKILIPVLVPIVIIVAFWLFPRGAQM